MKILIFGNGYIGNEYLNSNVFEDIFMSKMDITRMGEIETEIERFKPDVVLNCAGRTNLEWCRDNPLDTVMSNIQGPLSLLSACKKYNICLVHLGSGCIFEGDNGGQGFTEEDVPTPRCFYTYTKALADELLLKTGYKNLLILRIRQPFSDFSHPRNLITKLLSYEKLITSPNSMTYLPDLILATKHLLEKKANGIFNVCNTGVISPYEIAMAAKSILGLKNDFTPLEIARPKGPSGAQARARFLTGFTTISKVQLDEMDKKNNREKRVDTILSGDKLAKTGFEMLQVQQRVKESLQLF